MKIPALVRLTASPKPASRTGKAHWFLSDPNASSRHCVKRDGVGLHRDFIPPPLPYPQVSAPAVRPPRWCEPQLACAFPTNLEPARSGLRVCAGHSPAAPEPGDRQNRAVFDTPTRYKKEGLRPRFRRSEALSRTRWQVKDSNLRSFRDGFTDHRRQGRDQRECLSAEQLPCVFPTDTRPQPTTADNDRTQATTRGVLEDASSNARRAPFHALPARHSRSGSRDREAALRDLEVLRTAAERPGTDRPVVGECRQHVLDERLVLIPAWRQDTRDAEDRDFRDARLLQRDCE